jgi:phosphatidylinositol kinase/protein kinase (PI-3  family)
MAFEKAPFKFTQEYLDIMGGENSAMFEYFKSLLIRGLFEIRKHMDELIVLIQIMAAMPPSKMKTVEDKPNISPKPANNDWLGGLTTPSKPPPAIVDIGLPCVKNINTLEQELRDRVSGKFNVNPSKGNEFAELVERIVNHSLNNSTTKLYDYFQKNTNGIEP